MKLQSAQQTVEVSGANETASFRIAMNAKAFRVLSDTLYQNKIGSIVREISCNAYDSHVAAGKKDVPFEIHLPDPLEPWFAVRDFGTGMTKEVIYGVITEYFTSTKEQSNDSIGAFGLGAKTPFSYTDQFTITSTVNGYTMIWSAYITANGIPDVSLLEEFQSDDLDGVEIKVAVKREDFDNFRKETAIQLRHFKVKPNVTNGFINWEKRNLQVVTEDYAISKDKVSINDNNIQIVQGIVGYPLISANLRGKIDPTLVDFINILRSYNCDIYFEIGEIGVTASREGVEYNDTTVKNIEKKLALIRDEMSKEFRAQWDAVATLWEKALLKHENRYNSFFSGLLLGYGDYSTTTYMFSITELTHEEVVVHAASGDVKKYDPKVGIPVGPDGRAYVKQLRRVNDVMYRAASREGFTAWKHNTISVAKDIQIILVDESKYLTQRLKLMRKHGHDQFVFRNVTVDQIQKVLGGVKVELTSSITIEKAAKERESRVGVPTLKFIEAKPWSNGCQFNKVYDTKISEIEGDVIYEVRDDLRSEMYLSTELRQLFNIKGGDLPKIIIIREKDRKIAEQSGFIHADKYVEEQRETMTLSDSVMRRAQYWETMDSLREKLSGVGSEALSLWKRYDESRVAHKLNKVYTSMYNRSSKPKIDSVMEFLKVSAVPHQKCVEYVSAQVKEHPLYDLFANAMVHRVRPSTLEAVVKSVNKQMKG